MGQDIKRKLTADMGFPSDIAGEVLADIFMNKEGPTIFERLVDSNSEEFVKIEYAQGKLARI